MTDTIQAIVEAIKIRKIVRAIRNVPSELIIEALKQESPGVLNRIRKDNIKAVETFLKEECKRALELMLKEVDVHYVDDHEHKYYRGNTIKYELTATKQRLWMMKDKY